MAVDVSISDDYAVLEANEITFYAGYEWFGIVNGREPTEEEWEDDPDIETWGFVAYRGPSNKPSILLSIPGSYDWTWDEIERILLMGIGKFIEQELNGKSST
jgi:hypothetical protein